MTSQKQLEANRQNASNSTGPRTEHGKRRSRRNAFRHGLTAETVVCGLEDVRDFKAFQAAVISDYAPQSASEHELVLRLVSLLWRLRRATAIESGLFELQADLLTGNKTAGECVPKPASDLYRLLGLMAPIAPSPPASGTGDPIYTGGRQEALSHARRKDPRRVAHCYSRLVQMPDQIFERVGYYEARLWRQALQTLVILDAMRKSYDRLGPMVRRDAAAHRDLFGGRAFTRLW